jgi:sugar-phosphatase
MSRLYAGAMPLDSLTGRVFAAVLFDMDGTLIDSTPAVARAWKQWAEEFGVPLPGDGDWHWHGIPAGQVVSMLLPSDRVEEGARRIEEIETADTDGVVLLPGTVDALAALAALAVPGGPVWGRAAIVTSCTRPLADARIAAAGLEPPGVMVTADEVAVGKPDPAPYLLAAQRLGVDPADCLVVEDAPAGLTSGRAAGAATLALTTTTAYDELSADAIVADLSAVRFVSGADGVRIRDAAGGAR